MRDDMFEVIIERPRWGSRMRYPRSRRRVDKVVSRMDPDSLPFRLGHNRDIGQSLVHARKYLSETLNPLRRFLEGQVNRPWNKVWSEICANLKTSSTVLQHVRGHVMDFVAIDIICKDGERWVRSFWRGTIRLSESGYELYVDPRTGILRRNKPRKTRRQLCREEQAAETKKRHARMRELGPYLQAHLFNGAWWLVTLEPTPWERPLAAHNKPASWGYRDLRFTDVVRAAGLSPMPLHQLYGRDNIYAVAKRQLSRREAARLGLPR